MEIQREFDYKPPTGSLKLLGVLGVILAPLAAWQAMQGGVDEVNIRGKFWLDVRGPAAPWVFGAMIVVMAVAGYYMFKGGRQMDRTVGRIAFLPHNFLVNWRKVDKLEGAMPYKDISDIKVSEKRGRGILTFRYRDTKQIVYSKGMNSLQEFEEMCTELKQRVEAVHATSIA